jgi:hypothetical protein
MESSRKMKMAGWILSVLIALFLIVASAMGKFTQWEGKAEMFGKMGWTEAVMVKIGIIEVVIAALFLIPRTSFVAAILLTAYLGGAVATHVRVGDSFLFPVIIGVLTWFALGLRQPGVFPLSLGLHQPNQAAKT